MLSIKDEGAKNSQHQIYFTDEETKDPFSSNYVYIIGCQFPIGEKELSHNMPSMERIWHAPPLLRHTNQLISNALAILL